MTREEIENHFKNNGSLTIECKELKTGEIFEATFESVQDAVNFFDTFKDQTKIAYEHIYSA
jgi:hypothetical protein